MRILINSHFSLVGIVASVVSKGGLSPSSLTAMTRKKYSVPSTKLRILVTKTFGATSMPLIQLKREADLYSTMYIVTGVPPSLSGAFHSRSTKS